MIDLTNKPKTAENVARGIFVQERREFFQAATGTQRTKWENYCPECGFLCNSLFQRSPSFHAPDCDTFWMIDVFQEDGSPSRRNIDGWDWKSFVVNNEPPPSSVQLDSVPVWTLLNWDAIQGGKA